jgi:hypothetical protein
MLFRKQIGTRVASGIQGSRRLSENAHLRRYPYSSSLRRTAKYASFLRTADALHLNIFQQPPKKEVLRQGSRVILVVMFRYDRGVRPRV